MEVRPISSRALRSVADSLRPYLFESRVLDLYAGHGRLGGMALEEGALSAVFVEKDRRECAALKTTLRRFSDKAEIREGDALAFLESSQDVFDIIFCDPPFPLWTPEYTKKLWERGTPRLAQDGIFLVKHPKRVIPSFPDEAVQKISTFGDSSLIYLRHPSAALV